MKDQTCDSSGKVNRHLFVGMAVILIAVILERIVYMQYDRLRESPVILNDYMAIKPVYNMDGSWLHGRWGIGYNGPLLCLENIVTFFAAVYLLRFMDSFNVFFRIAGARRWLYAADVEAAVMLYRLFSKIYSPYTLDYLWIRGYGTFDFPDFCIGAGIAVIVIWMIVMMCRYYPFKTRQTAGMSFRQKCRWEIGFTLMLLKATVVSKDRWEDLFAGWRAV